MLSTAPNAAASPARTQPILSVQDLAVSFDNGSGPRVQAVAGVSMTVHPNQTLAVVGESGCGKSVTAMSTMQLIPRPPMGTTKPVRVDASTARCRCRALRTR